MRKMRWVVGVFFILSGLAIPGMLEDGGLMAASKGNRIAEHSARAKMAVSEAANRAKAPKDQLEKSNPFFEASTLPFHAPPFDLIKDSDFQSAIDEGMRRKLEEVEKIANTPEPPTFENTIVAMEKTGQLLERVQLAFNALNGANTDNTLQKVEEYEAPRLAAHHDAIFLNEKLFQRVEKIYEERDKLHLSPEGLKLVEVDYHYFVHAGAKLPDTDKAKLREINKELSTLQAAFHVKLLAGTKAGALVVDDKAKLAGLSDNAIAAAAQAAESRELKGKWVIPLQNTTQQPSLQSLENRDVRKELFEDSWTRTEKGDANDTRDTIATMAKLRAEKAALLGFPNYAAYVLEDQMAKNPEAVESFVGKLVPAATA